VESAWNVPGSRVCESQTSDVLFGSQRGDSMETYEKIEYLLADIRVKADQLMIQDEEAHNATQVCQTDRCHHSTLMRSWRKKTSPRLKHGSGYSPNSLTLADVLRNR